MSIIEEKLNILPSLSGCYLMKDKNDTIIYVGKAKILKNRVKSYFRGSHNAKTTKLVSEIVDFDYIVTSSELEALVLEINLIKKHDPKYNIMLTDDKTYPYIVLTNEMHPRLFVTRTTKKTKIGKYYGPYPNVKSARSTCELLNNIYPFRKCHNLPKKECLYYHMHSCLAPCIFKEKFDYSAYKNEVNQFLNGEASIVLKDLNQKMITASNNLEFEKAMEYRDLINDINHTIEKQKISINDLIAKDIIGFDYTDDEISIHILMMRSGNIVQNDVDIFSYVGDVNESLITYLVQYYSNESIRPKEIYINELNNNNILKELLSINIVTPQKGVKKDILNMANDNAKKDLVNKRLLYKNQVLKKIETIESLGNILQISTPTYIEAFDNSNLNGEYPVSAMVVFRNGKPSPKEYRKYHIKTVVGANDYMSMKEVIYRRYLKLKMEDLPFPNLIVMDGGEIQVNAALETLNSLNIDIPVMGIKKDINHKANLIVYNNKEIPVSKNSDIYLLLANISQTVHDFAISFFRSQKAKSIFSSKLDGINSLGPKRKEKLLKHFITIDKIKKASIEEIEGLGIPKNVASDLLKHLNDDLE